MHILNRFTGLLLVEHRLNYSPMFLKPLQTTTDNSTGLTPAIADSIPTIALGAGVLLFLGLIWYVSGYLGDRFLDKAVDEDFWSWSIGREIVLVARGVLLVAAVSIVLLVLNVDLLSVVGSPSVITLILGIILTPLAALLINGLALRYSRRFDENDVIELRESGIRGIVDNFSLTHIKIITLDNEYLTIPIWRIRNKDIINYSRNGDARRLSIDVLVTYDSSIEAARTALRIAAESVDDVVDAASNSEYVVDSDMRTRIHDDISVCLDPRCRIEQFADSGILLRLYFWVEEPATIARIKSEIMANINAAEGDEFHFAFPHVRVLGTGSNNELELSGI